MVDEILAKILLAVRSRLGGSPIRAVGQQRQARRTQQQDENDGG